MPKRVVDPSFKNLEAYVAKQIRGLRQSKKLTQEELAEKANVSSKFISRVETIGENVSLHSLAIFAKALDCKAGDLLPKNELHGESSVASEAKSLIDALDKNKKIKSIQLIVEIIQVVSAQI